MKRPVADWRVVADLIEQVVALPALMDDLVDEVQGTVREVAGLDASDVARHTRALLAAATRAVAARRGPTEQELAFVEELSVTRARQGVPIHAVLSAIHLSERTIWARARQTALDTGVDPVLLLDARELYDDWALKVRERLLHAYRLTERSAARADRDQELVDRLLRGGPTAALAAAQAGLPVTGLWVWVSLDLRTSPLIDEVRRRRIGVAARVGGEAVAIVRVPPDGTAQPGRTASRGRTESPDRIASPDRMTEFLDAPSTVDATLLVAAGPSAAEYLGSLRNQASAAARTGRRRGLSGVHRVGELASLAAIDGRADLAERLLARYGPALDAIGERAEIDVATTRAYLELSCDADAAAARELVHPNTVRNRVDAVLTATGIEASDPFQAVNLWWLCATWLEQHRGCGGNT